MNRDFKDMRQDYQVGELVEHTIDPNPMVQFARWFDEAQQSNQLEPNAMILSTIDNAGFPDSRTVLVKEIVDGNFVFYTNYDSAKGQQVENAGKVHLLFLWLSLERQVRIQGTIMRIPKAQSEAYFKSRPYGSQVGAWASPQSEVIPDRAYLEQKLAAMMEQYPEGSDIPLPPNWGGYAVTPTAMEFWQGRSSRLHDRIKYTKEGTQWHIERLAP